ncbi:putative dna repair and recombination protein rad5c protein [Eutypa lata UCREL1]|uniref:Putative dna repair and recombination protein rad5c protein n=1 Tax=Eutypa lata (strain UCR-EL1) TaxID=1287681 RepID=M7SIN8_EUTLA|nr:putative dna repair and recombination protein rad5c protein [Eutypa lata UCREL1]
MPVQIDENDGDRICYGMIYQVDVKLSEQNMPELSSKLRDSQAGDHPSQSIQTFTVEPKTDHMVLSFQDGAPFGILRDNLFKSLSPVLQREKALLLEGVAITHVICDRIGKINKSSDRVIQVDINVYGRRQDGKRIGDELASKKIWLQRPDKARLPYENPHVINFPGIEQASVSINDVQANSGANRPELEGEERVQQFVSEVHDSLQRANELETTTGDRRLKTGLLEHQQRALTFMRQRESGNIPERFRLWKKSQFEGQEMYIHRVTKTRSALQPEERGGGILADEMGMGKSLCLLALVLETLVDGRKWAEEKQQEEHHSSKIKRYSHSTLLDKIGWFRIVLDEAHVIRRPATHFYRTCMELEARSRWCLTGTPIQNRLQDIGALFAFLRAEPFHSIALFRRFIVAPFDQGDPVVKDRLVQLYDSLCLRRTKDLLTLPGVKEHIRQLEFSPEERLHYQGTMNILDRSIRERVGQYDPKGKFGQFQARLQLRILCNHGTYQKPFSWKRSSLKDANEALTVDLGMDIEVRTGPVELAKAPVSNPNHQNHMGPAGVQWSQQDTLPSKDEYFNAEGYSVKMKALVEDVQKDLEEMKSIVFSCWTSTLDLVGRHLQNENIDYIRIDGNTLMSKRQRLLDQFDKESGARVLLMTTGTGAFGLNITAAKRVFIVELQWNPSVENQAIARTIRLGQKKEVIVIRYMIKDTVEEEIQSQQTNKRKVARLGW